MLSSLFAPGALRLDLDGTSQDDVLAELVGLLRLDGPDAATLQKLLKRRESVFRGGRPRR